MIRYFLTYATEAEEDAIAANTALTELGLHNTQDMHADRTAALSAADFLFVLLTAAEQVDERSVRQCWTYFDNEIRWKRKPHGEILFLVPDEEALGALPLRLKQYGYYLLDEIDDVASYCNEALRAADEEAQRAKEAVPAVKQIKYSPPEETVKQIEFSVRAPSVPSFDGTVRPAQGEEGSSANKDSGACRRDHIFEELRHDDGGLYGRTQLSNARKKKRNRGLLALFLLVMAVVFIVAVVLTCRNLAGDASLRRVEASCGEIARISDVRLPNGRLLR